MLELYTTPLDFLYLTLSVCVGLLTLFLLMALFHTIRILSNFRKVSEKAKDTVDLVNHYLWQPIKIMLMVIERLKDMQVNVKAKKHKSK